MESKRRIITVSIVAAIVLLASLPCAIAQDSDNQDRRGREGQRMPRPGERGGPRQGERGRRGIPDGSGRRPGRPDGRWRRPELTDEQIDSVLKELTKRDPNTAKELAELRKEDPNEFRNELRGSAGPEIGRVIMQIWTERRRAEFLKWLENYVPKEAEELARLKDKEPDLYEQKYELTWRIYDRIYERTRRNPELAKVLVTDLQLRERQRELQSKYRAAKAEEDKKELMAQLEEVVSDRYDLIVRQKQMEYEQLLRRLEALQNQVKESLKDIKIWKTDEFKEKIINERMEDLTTRGLEFDWPDR